MIKEKSVLNAHKPSNQLQALKKAKELAEKAARDATTLSGCITHELRTILSIIRVYAELLGNNCKNGASSKKNKQFAIHCLDTIKQTIKNADYLIGNLLLQVKGVAKGKVNKKDFNYYSITKNIEEVLAQYPLRVGGRKLEMVVEGSDFYYVGNSILTNHILFNLLKNALRAIKNAGKGKITIQLKPDKAFNQLIFTDTASGIPKKFLPKIFDQFESQMTAQGGTGLGLAFCKIIMNSYDGDITCKSEEGKYTEFTLRFPRVPAQQ